MNKTFISIYNEALGAWVAASEVTKSSSKKSSSASSIAPSDSKRRFKLSMFAAAAFGLFSVGAMAQSQITVGPMNQFNGGAGQIYTNDLIRPNGSVLCTPSNSYSVTNGNNTGYNYAIAGAYNDCIIALANDFLKVDAGASGPVRYSSAPNLTTPNGGTVTNDVTLVGATAAPVGLHNVANGLVGANSTDAVNGGQLNTTNGNVTAVDNRVTTVDGRVTNLNNSVNNGTIGLVQQVGGAPGAGLITVGAQTAGSVVSVAGTGGNRTLTGVANGTVNDASVDAVNGSQLSGIDKRVTINEGDLTNIKNGGGIKYFHTNSGGIDSSAAGAESVAVGSKAVVGTGSPGGVAIGFNATVAGTAGDTGGNVAIGRNATSLNGDSTTIGADSKATNLFSTAVGARAVTTGYGGTAFGTGAKAVDYGSTAIGWNALATGNSDTALGVTANASGGGSTAIGTAASATGYAGVALGPNVVAGGRIATAIGFSTNVGGTTSSALGPFNVVAGDNSAVLGNSNNVPTNNTFVVGNGVNTTGAGDGNVVLGNASTIAPPSGLAYATAAAAPGSQVSIGAAGAERRVTNMSAGSVATDGVNVGQLNQVAQNTVGALGGGAAYNPTTGAYTGPTFVTPAGTTAKTVQGALTNTTTAITQLGNNTASNFGGGSSYNAGNGTLSPPTYIIGTTPYDNVGAALAALNSTGAKYFHANSVLPDSAATGINSVAIGPNAVAKNAGDVALGNGSVTKAVTSSTGVTFGVSPNSTYVFAGSAPVAAVSVGAPGAEKQIQNVASGSLAADSTDAVNGSQVFATNQQLTKISNGELGPVQRTGAANQLALIASGGSGISPGVPQVLTNVAEGKIATGSTEAVNGSQIVSLKSVADNSVQYDNAAKSSVTFGGITGTKLSNVADGTVLMGSKDAVNGGQLFGVDSKITNIIEGKAGLVQQAGPGAPITVGAATGGSEVNIAGTAGARKITNVFNGVVALDSKDAVNGGQLFGVDSRVTNLTTNITEGKIGLVQQATPSAKVTVAASTGGTEVDFAGVGGPRKLTSVANGIVAIDSKDAVNGGQLKTVSDVASNSVQYDNAGKTLITLGGVGAASPTTLTNVKAGKLSDTSLDAVNGSQLFETNANVTNVTNTVNNIQNGAGIKYFHANSTLADSTAVGVDSVAIGPKANARYAYSVAIGSESETGLVAPTGAGFVTGSQAPASEVSIGSATQQRRLSNLSAGSAATDAVNVSQLKGVTDNFNTVIGQTVFDPLTGKALPSTFNIQGGSYSNVTTAFGAVDKSVTNLITSVTNGSIGPVQYSNPLTPTTPNGGTKTNDLTLVGATAGAVALHNVAAGLTTDTSTDAINGSQLNKVGTSIAKNFGGDSTYDATTGTVTAPTFIVNGGKYDNAGAAFAAIDKSISGGEGIKYFHAKSTLADSSATGVDSVAVGPVAIASADKSMALGANASATKANSVALGAGSVADRGALSGYTAFGLSKVQDSVGEVSVGSTGKARQITNVAAGRDETDAVNVGQLTGAVNGLGDSLTNVLGGSYNKVTGAYTGPTYNTYGGTTATTIQDAFNNYNTIVTKIENGGVGPVQYSNADTPKQPNGGIKTNDVTLVGKETGPVGLHNVANGSTADDSTDAVNGSQLNKVGTSIAINFGGGSKYDPTTGTVTGPTYNIQGGSYNNVGSALTKLDTATTNNSTAITNITNGTSGIVRQEGGTPGEGTITVGKETGGTKVDITNNAGATRVLTGVGDGALASGSKDAVNGGQLFETNEKVRTITTGGGIKYFHANSTGADSNAAGTDSIAVGPTAVSKGTGSVAVGSGALTDADRATAVGQGAQATAPGSVALGAGSVADRGAETYRPVYFNNGNAFTSAGTVSVGSEGAERVISNVAPGVRDTDAANVGQVKGLSNTVSRRLDSMERGSNRAIASTAALSFQPVQQHPGQFVMSAGLGHYQGETALGVGGNYLFKSGRQKIYAGVAGASGGKPVVQVGFSAAFGD
jgi:autotransporter adhesin